MALVVAALGGAVLCGCDARLRLTDVAVARAGWDTLYVTPSFRAGGRAAEPARVAVWVLDGADTLRVVRGVGAGPYRLVVPDARRASEASLLVEVCGWDAVAGALACGQTGLRASPKRTRAALAVAFPDALGRPRGRYAFVATRERRRARGAGWEPLPGGADRPVLRAAVAGFDRDAVGVPLGAPAGRFRLDTGAGADAFGFRLDGHRFYGEPAPLRFTLHDGAGPPLAVRLDTLAAPDAAARARLASAWARRLADALVRRGGGRRAEAAWVDSVRYDRVRGRYAFDLRVRWRDAAGAAVVQAGRAEVDEATGTARFLPVQLGS